MKTLHLPTISILVLAPMLGTVAYAQSAAISDMTTKKDGPIISEVELDSTNGSQWIKVYNPSDKEISLATMYINSSHGEVLGILGGMDGLPPKNSGTVTIQSQKWSNVNNSITIFPYPPGTKGVVDPPLWDRTPALSDTDSDSNTWQYDGNKWMFAEQNTVAIPEFPLAIPVLLVGVISVTAFYRTQFRK